MRKILIFLFIFTCGVSEWAWSYGGDDFGHGVYGGSEGCGYDNDSGAGVLAKDDEWAGYYKDAQKSKKKFLQAKSKLSRKKAQLRKEKKTLREFFKAEAADDLFEHIEGNKEGTGGGDNSNYKLNEECGEGSSRVSKLWCNKETKESTFTNLIIHNGGEGEVNAEAACEGDNPRVLREKTSRYDFNKGRCQKALEKIKDLAAEVADLERDRAENEAEYDYNKEMMGDRRDQVEEEIEDDTYVEGSTCLICNHSRSDKTARIMGSVLGVATALGGAWTSYNSAKHISEQNARLGWPTQPWIAGQAAYPYIMQGIYGGIMGGMGKGGYGCSGGYYGLGPNGMMGPGGLAGAGMYGPGGGAFGYPPWMQGAGPWGAGPYMPGMGPWGIPGPFQGGFPNGGGFPGNMIGAAYGGYPVGGYPAGMQMGGFPYGGYQMGFPYGALQIGGLQYASVTGFQNGGGFQLAGMQLAGMQLAGLQLAGLQIGAMQMGGFQLAGMQLGGLQLAGLQLAGLQIGGIGTPPFMPGAAMGLQIGGLQIGGALGGAQFQQQYLQQYMAQLQAAQQAQMQQQQDWIQKQQVVGRLTEELVRIQTQIQQISSGSFYGTGSTIYTPSLLNNGTTTGTKTGTGQRILGR